MKPDFLKSSPGDDPIRIQGYFPVPPEKAFRAWTDPHVVMKWFGSAPNTLHSANIDLRVGGGWKFVESKLENHSIWFEGEYLEITPGKHLLFTWTKVIQYRNEEPDRTNSSLVEITFTEIDNGTEIHLIHSHIERLAERQGFAGGWRFAIEALWKLFIRN